MPDQPPTSAAIDVVSDVVCPWCFIGKRRLETGARAAARHSGRRCIGIPISSIDWIPREGISREEYLTTKFGSAERYDGIAQRVAAAAAAEGLDLRLGQDRPPAQHARLPSADPLGAKRSATAAAMKQRLMELYFTEGADLTDPEVLVAAPPPTAASTPNECASALASDRTSPRSSRRRNPAKEAGIDGVPCFIFGGIFAVSGAQSPEDLAEAMARAAAERKRRMAEQPAT